LKRQQFTLFILVLTVLTFRHAYAGKYAAEFLVLGSGAQGQAMGMAMCAVARDPFSFYWNPAGLAEVNQRSLSATTASTFGSISDPLGTQFHAGFTMPFGRANFAVNYLRYSVSEIPWFPEYDDDDYTFEERRRLIEEREGNPFGDFSSNDQALYVSFAKKNDLKIHFGWVYRDIPLQIPMGMNFKVISTGIDDESGWGMSADAGIQVKAKLKDLINLGELGEITLATRVENFANTGIQWNGGSDAIHYNYVFGYSWATQVKSISWTISTDVDNRYSRSVNRGLEIGYLKKLFFRGGFQGRDEEWTYGAGINIGTMVLDYAGLEHDLGRSHRFSIVFKF
jgi:hypothetical protein